MRLYDVFLQDADPLKESQTADMRAFFAGADRDNPVQNPGRPATPAEIKALMTKMIQFGERSLTQSELSKVKEYQRGRRLFVSRRMDVGEQGVAEGLNEFAPGDGGNDEKQYLLQLADELANAMYGSNKSTQATKDIKNEIIAAGGDVKISYNDDTSFNVVMYHPTYFKQGHLIKLVGNQDTVDEAFRLGSKRLGNRRDRFKSIHKPSLVETEPIHRIGVTVTDPNHPMVGKRGELVQKNIRVTHADREAAINKAIAHYRRKGYKVHDHHYIGTVEQDIEESNVFTDARMNAIKAGQDTFVVHGKKYPVTGDTTDEKQAEFNEDLSRRGFLRGAGAAAGMAAMGGARASSWDPTDVAAGGHNQLPDIVAHIKFRVGDKEITKDINLGSYYRSPGEASKELENFMKSKGIRFYEYSLERVKPAAGYKIDSSPATSNMKGSMDTSEPAASGPSADDYMAKEGMSEDWNKVNHHDRTNGLSQKAVNAYRREHPGSKLKTAVTTKPSKLKPGSKAAKRRKSFCARMSGNKGPMKKPNGKPTPKALALRRWHCESVEEMQQMIARGEQMIAEMKQQHLGEEWSQKYKNSINCSHPKGFSQKAHCAGKKKHNESVEMEMVCEDCGMCQTHGNLNEIAKGAKDANGVTKCWPGYHAAGTKKGKNGGQVRNCVPNESQGVAEDLSRRGFLRGAGAAAVAGAAGPEIVTLVKGFAEQAGGMNGIQALKAMLKIATADELYNMYDYYSDSGIMSDAITDSDMRALQRVKGFRDYEDWSDFEEYCEDNNDVDPAEEFERLTGRPLKVSLVNDILKKVDNTWSLENFFDEYPDALKLIDPFENGSISRPTMQQLAHIDKEAKGAHLPTPIVTMANAVAGLVRQIFKANGQPLSAPQQVAQTSRAAPALPAPTRPEFDITPDLKQKEKVPVQRQGDDEEQGVTEGSNDPAKDALIQALTGHSVDDPRELWVDLKEIGRGFKTPVSKQIRMALRSLSPDDAYELWDTALEIAGVTQDELDNMTDDMDDSRDVWDGNLRGVSPPATGQKKTKHKIHKTIYIESQGVAEGKITLSTDPNWYGATVDNYQASGPVVNIPANQLVGFEPDDKMNQPKSKANVEKIVAGLKQGAKLPPLLIRKYKNGYQVLDGHHRFWAYKLLGVKSIPAQIVPDSDIEEISKQGVAEGSENNNPIANKIFFARSNKTPKGWSYDHVGFITQDGKQIQMSGHKGNDVYVTNDVTDDPEFPKQNIKIVSLSKPVSVPTTNSVGAENCGTFVANVLQANGIKGIDTQKIYSVFKKPQEQGVAEAGTSAAVRLGNAIQRVQGKTAASQARSVIPSSIPKPEPKRDEKTNERMMPASMFAGSKKNKLGPAGQWKNTGPKKNKPAQDGDLVGGMEEGKKPEHNLGTGWMLDKDKELGRKVDQNRARSVIPSSIPKKEEPKKDEKKVDEAFSLPTMDDVKAKLLKIKAALGQEADETKQMFGTYVKHSRGQASDQEMAAANEQLKDVLRGVGMGVFALVPGHIITVPLLFGLAKKYNIQLLPSAFRSEPAPQAQPVAEGIQVGDGFIIECGDSAIETVVLGNYHDGILIEFDHTATFMLIDHGIVLTEAEYQGHAVPLGKPTAGDVKKSKVYVKKPNGNVVKVNFGDKNMTIKKHLPDHRKSYRARHHCEDPGPKWKANYWSCRAW